MQYNAVRDKPEETVAEFFDKVFTFADARQVECNMELEDGSGAVWLRVAGWCDWLRSTRKR